MDLTSLIPSLPSSSRTTFDFPLDPSLGGPIASGSGGGGGGSGNNNNNYYQDDEFDDNSDEFDSSSSNDDDNEDSEGEGEDDEDGDTDAEDEYLNAMNGIEGNSSGKNNSQKRKRSSSTVISSGKAKEKEFINVPTVSQVGFEDRQELGRLITAIRESTSQSVGGKTALDKEFDRSIAEELEGIDDEEEDASYRKKSSLATSGYPKKNPQPRRVAREPEPSAEVQYMLGQANQHYARGENEEALQILTEVIRIDPNIRSPWYTLATIYEESGDKKKSIELKIVAAHLSGIKSGAREWADLAEQARQEGLLQQAIYCFTQAIKGDKDDTDSMWDRAVLLKMSGNTKQAIKAFTAILNLVPHNIGVLRELIPLLLEEESYAKATDLYSASFEHFQQTHPHILTEDLDSEDLFSSEDLETLADLLIQQKLFSKAVSIVKTGVRWLQGRDRETMWESMNDDREFDLLRKTREGWERDSKFSEGAAVYELDPRFRVRLGTARMGEGRIDEAKYHYDVILQEDVAEFPELYGAVADSYFEKKLFAEALQVYQEMATNDEINGPLVWMKAGQCSHELGELEDARECYEAVEADQPDNIQAKMQLARLYEQMNEPSKALAMITQVIAAQKLLRESGAAEATVSTKVRKPKTQKQPLTKEGRIAKQADKIAAEEARHAEFAAAFAKLGVLNDSVDQGDEDAITEWLEVATYLVDSFRETTQLFPSDPRKKFRGVLSRNWTRKGTTENMEKQAGEMASRLERNLDKDDQEVEADSFRGLHFDKWLSLIIKYAFILTKNDEVEAGLETLTHVSAASPFKQSEQRTVALSLARVACSLHVEDYPKVLEVTRGIWVRYSYRTDALRLFQAIVPSGIACIEGFNTGALQKYTIRQLKGIANSAEINGGTTNSAKGKGKNVPRDDDDEEEEAEPDNQDDEEEEEEEREREITRKNSGPSYKPTKLNPLYLITYGCMLLTSRSFQSAIIYLLRAYDISPEEPLVNLALGIAYLNRAMSRQTDNRQHQIVQGMAFLMQYRKALGACQETEYNLARAYHHLGQHSYAVKHYEQVLKIASAAQEIRMAIENENENEEEVEDPHDFSKLAAYNLSGLYVFSNLPNLAREISRKWLSV